MSKLLVMVVAALSMMLVVSPAFAQGDPSEAEGMVEGVFRVTIEGELPENYSIYAETDQAVGGMAPICTTDAAMVAEGYTECTGGGAMNELTFFAPEGATVEYRILGSQGTGLSQEVIAEGSTVAETDGFTVDASHSFAGDPETPEDPEATPEQDDTGSDVSEPDVSEPDVSEPDVLSEPGDTGLSGTGSGAADDQYADEATTGETPPEDAPAESDGEMSKVAEANGGVLPDTGGAPLSLLAGAALILAAGGFLAHRLTR